MQNQILDFQEAKPIGSIFTYLYHKNEPNVGKYTVRPMNPLGFGSNPLDPKMAEEQVSVPVLSLEGPCSEKHRTTVGHQKRTNRNTPKAFVNFELGKTLVRSRKIQQKQRFMDDT